MHRFAAVTGLTLLLSSPAAGQQSPIDNMQWIVGCWEMARGTMRVVERWMGPAQGEMLGESRTTVNGVERESERLRIFVSRDTLVYAAIPSGQQPTEFRAIATSPNEITFANPAHDFPQRIVYRRVPPDSLVARIEGDRDGRRGPVTFPYRRIECPARTESPAAVTKATLKPKYDDMVARELSYLGGVNGWFADNAGPGFTHIIWTTSSPSVPVATREVLARANEGMRANPNRVQVSDRRFSATVEQVLVRGDTADILVSTRYTWNFIDTAGRYGAAGGQHERDGVQRRLDTWLRDGAEWRLRTVVVIGDEVMIDGRVVLKDGKAVAR